MIDPNSHKITYSYDADNAETGETWVNPGMGSPLNLVTITYDADHNVTQIRDANSNYQYTYNADDEVSTFADNGTTGLPLVTLTYGYDGNNNVTSVSDSLGGLLTLAYDARDEETNEKFTASGLSDEAVTYAYDNAGRLTGLTRYSNAAETTKVAATAYSYDHADRMTGIVDTNSTGTTLVTYGYTYDAADRVTQEVRTWASGGSSDTVTYSYTNNNQLTGVTHSNGSFSNESFAWDANGNETGTGYTTGTDNEQTASPGYTYTYDNAGEMTAETNTSTGNVWTYGYDFRGRMVTAVEKTPGGTTLESVTYTYDALDNRIGTDENSTQTWTLYASGTPVMDFNGSSSLTMRYLWGPIGIAARQTSGGTVSWYLADALGTVRDLINNSGAIIDHVDFSAFGSVIAETSPTNGDRFVGFAMLERDTVTGLNLAVHREENPGTGRWDSQDPLGFSAGDSNLFRYVGNGPATSADPDGMDWLDDYTRWFKLHGRPGFWEGLIPVWGSGRTAYDDYRNGKPYWGTFWVVVAATDIFLVRSLATGAVKGLWKFGGSHTWTATRTWALNRGWCTTAEEIHHWAAARNIGWGRRIPDWIKNQPWNFRNFPKGSRLHNAIHGYGPYAPWAWPIRIFIAPPTWIKLLPISIFPRFGPLVPDGISDDPLP